MPMFAKELERLMGRRCWTRQVSKGSTIMCWNGRRQESVKAVVDTVVIDHIERPSEN
jgi:hypothetical protein